jgi:hypothetical protein
MKKNSENNELKTILVINTGFLVLYFFTKNNLFFFSTLIISFGSLIFPLSIKYILWVWERIGLILGWINTRVILALVFYLILFPISKLTRLKYRNLLQLTNRDNSVFFERNHQYTKEDIINPW